MKRFVWMALLGLVCVACGGGIDSYEDGMEAQLDLMEEMADLLEEVTDAESAQAATSELEVFGERFAEIAARMQELPVPEVDELQELAQDFMARSMKVQQRTYTQMLKLADYPELGEAFTRAMSQAR